MRFRSSALSKAVALALGVAVSTALTVSAQEDEEDSLEEVLVTGSFIKGSPEDAPSPVQVIDRTSIDAQGAATVWDVIKNLEVNSGSFSNTQLSGAGGEQMSQLLSLIHI